jgi:hypothetical protein
LSEFEEKVLKLLEEINRKLDSLLNEEPSPTPEVSSPAPTPTTASETSYLKPSELVEKQKEEEKLEDKPPLEGRRVCPDCSGTAFNAVEDKSHVLHQMGGVKIYAKKYVCKRCGREL